MNPILRPLVLALGIATFARAQSAAELEAKFKETFAGVTLAGTSNIVKDGALAPEQPDKYAIERIEKVGGDDWVIHAHFQYKKQDMVVPVPVKVKWAGDTAVIVVDRMQVPGGAYGATAYSARLVVFENAYAGTWSGGGHAGTLSGVIVKKTP